MILAIIITIALTVGAIELIARMFELVDNDLQTCCCDGNQQLLTVIQPTEDSLMTYATIEPVQIATEPRIEEVKFTINIDTGFPHWTEITDPCWIHYDMNISHGVIIDGVCTRCGIEMRHERLFDVYKDGYPVRVSAEHQWLVRDLLTEHGYCYRVLGFGLIVNESTFRVDAIGGSRCMTHHTCERRCSDDQGCLTACLRQITPCVMRGRWFGWTQMTHHWLTTGDLTPYRLTDDHASRNLFNPEHNLLTTIEKWNYGRDVYGIDTDTELGIRQILWYHSTGRNPTNVTLDSHRDWYNAYARQVYRYADELVSLW